MNGENNVGYNEDYYESMSSTGVSSSSPWPMPAPGPAPIPQPTPTPVYTSTPTPTPTPTSPSDVSDGSNSNPESESGQISSDRFDVHDNGDGTKTIYDNVNGLTIEYSGDGEYKAYRDGEEVYHIYPDGVTSFRNPDGSYIISYDHRTIEDIKPNAVIRDGNGNFYGFNGSSFEEITDFNKYSRFYERQNDDGTTVFYDIKNKWEIKTDESGNTYAYNTKGEEIYHIYPDGVTSFRTRNGELVIIKPPISKEQIDANMSFEDPYGNSYVIEDNLLVEKTDTNGVVSRYTYETDDTYRIDQSDGHVLYYKDGKNYKHIYPDGAFAITDQDGELHYFKPDGTYLFGDKTGTYTIGEDDSIICVSDDGDTRVYNKYGINTKYITKDGVEYNYDYDKKSQQEIRRGNTSYSRINHIEYDEEAYDVILKTLNEAEENYYVPIKNEQSKIENAIGSFPDKYNGKEISEVISNIEVHINLINSLSEMTNYSLLAYQTCDESLKTKLEGLVDSLFGDADIVMGEKFKEAINYTIETNNGIRTYKEETNFWKTEYIVNLLVDYPGSTILQGEELDKFIEENNIKDLETLVISRDIVCINGVNVPVYRVADTQNLDIEGYNQYINDSNGAIGNVDSRVLQYMVDSGATVSYFSGYTVDRGSYLEDGSFKDGSFAGYANSENLNTVAVYRPNNQDDVDCILHELGHTFDHCIYHNSTGEHGTTTSEGFDYSLFPNGTSTRELARTEYGGYDPNYVPLDDYGNSGAYSPNEFFAESFRNFYSSNPDKRAEFADLIPDTFEFFRKMEGWAGEQNENK